MSFELIIVALVTLVGGLFAMAELAILSARKSRLEDLAERGQRSAQIALELANNPQEFLSTVQFGMTLCSIFSGAFGGATLSEDVENWIHNIPIIAAYSKPIAFFSVVASITYITIVLGELVPKTLGLRFAEEIACIAAPTMKMLSRIARPVVRILSKSVSVVLKVFRLEAEHEEKDLTQDEIQIVLAQGRESGVIEETEHEIVSRVLTLGDKLVKLLMVPRMEVQYLDLNEPYEKSVEKIVQFHHTYFPLCEGSLDRIVGLVAVKDVMAKLLTNKRVDLRSLAKTPLFVPDNLSALRVLKRFQDTKHHVALVLDEYGSFEGLITLNDFAGALLGQVSEPEHDEHPLIVQRQDGSYLLDGQLSLNELKELIKVEKLPEEEEGNYITLAGMIMAYLGRIPNIGEHFTWSDVYFEVVDMDGKRIDRVLVRLMPGSNDK